MDILLFILVIVALIIVHEFGHFVVAKLSGMRVDEFGLGYPPKLAGVKIGETEYTLNALPFGGFVKIYGEDGGVEGSRAFSARPRVLQAAVLVAGITMNLLFAYVLITGALVVGTPRALSSEELAGAKNVQLAIADILPDSPGAAAGFKQGDLIIQADDAGGTWSAVDPESFTDFISKSQGEKITFAVKRGDTLFSLQATPATGLISQDPSRYAVGVQVVSVGTVPLSFFEALKEGARLTWGATVATALGLLHFFAGVFTFSADLSQVAGPVGIVHVVGSAGAAGLGDLLSIMAIISINLALINVLPIPALDGGRLLFVIIESIIRKPIKASVAQAINGIGFAFLVLVMVVVTVHDIFKMVG